MLIFAVDKIKELEHVDEHRAITMLVASCAVCVVGYLIGLFWPLRADQFSPTAFLKRATFEPQRAIEEATEDLIGAYRDNERVLFCKRLVILIAIILLGSAVVAITQARLRGT